MWHSAVIVAGCSSGTSGTDASSSSSSSSASSTSAETAPNPLAAKAGDEYKAYAIDQIDQLIAKVKVLTDAVRAGNLKAAQDAYAPSRMPWERIEPIAELIPDVDAKTDSRVDDFASPDDPAFTGWHRLEYLLFEKNTTEGGAPFADQLDKDLAGLKDEVTKLEVPPLKVATGAAELIEEVSSGQDHRRRGSLLQDRPLGLRRQPAGFASRSRQADTCPTASQSRAARQDRRRNHRHLRHARSAASG